MLHLGQVLAEGTYAEVQADPRRRCRRSTSAARAQPRPTTGCGATVVGNIDRREGGRDARLTGLHAGYGHGAPRRRRHRPASVAPAGGPGTTAGKTTLLRTALGLLKAGCGRPRISPASRPTSACGAVSALPCRRFRATSRRGTPARRRHVARGPRRLDEALADLFPALGGSRAGGAPVRRAAPAARHRARPHRPARARARRATEGIRRPSSRRSRTRYLTPPTRRAVRCCSSSRASGSRSARRADYVVLQSGRVTSRARAAARPPSTACARRWRCRRSRGGGWPPATDGTARADGEEHGRGPGPRRAPARTSSPRRNGPPPRCATPCTHPGARSSTGTSTP